MKHDWNQTRDNQSRSVQLVEQMEALDTEDFIDEAIFEDDKIAQRYTNSFGNVEMTTTNKEEHSEGLLCFIINDISRTLTSWIDTFYIFPDRKVSISFCAVNNFFGSSVEQPYSIMDSGADTSVAGEGWIIFAADQQRRINIIWFDSEKARKTGQRIVKAVIAVDIPGRKEPILIKISEAAFNPSSKHSLLSEFQLKQYGCIVDSIIRRYDGQQVFFPRGEEGPKIHLRFKDCLLHFKSCYPNAEELDTIEPVDVTEGEVLWRSSDHQDKKNKIDVEDNHIIDHPSALWSHEDDETVQVNNLSIEINRGSIPEDGEP